LERGLCNSNPYSSGSKESQANKQDVVGKLDHI
jgi:hypothetical protein